MTRTVKTIVAAAALIAASAVHAEWQFASGSASLTFSQDAGLLLDASGAYLWNDDVNNKAHVGYVGNTAILSLDFTAGTTAGSHIQTLTSTGSTAYISRSVFRAGNPLVDRSITLSDFVLDLDTRTLSAHVTGTDHLANTTADYGFTAIYSATSFVGGHISPGATVGGITPGTASGHTEGPLTLSMSSNFLTILGLPQTGPLADLTRSSNWGMLTLNSSTFQAAVPEPSATLSILFGLAVLGAVRARRQTI